MRKLIMMIAGLLLTGAVITALVGNGPRPKVKAPNPRYSAPAITPQVVEDTRGFTVLISNESMEGISRGSGILLSSTTVLTCAHVLPRDKTKKGMKNMWIYPYPGNQVIHAKLKFVNYPKDLALLELKTPVLAKKYPTFAQKAIPGEPILVSGNILGYMMWFVSYGIISGEHQRWVLTDALIHGGNSGGPWVNAKGEVVALTDVGWTESDGREVGISGGVPTEDLQAFLTHSKQKKSDVLYELTGE